MQDEEGEELLRRRQALLTMPIQCSQLLHERPNLDDAQVESVWQQLQNWAPFEQVAAAAKDEDESGAEFLDHRHARAGLLAVLVCVGRNWLQKNPSRRTEVEAEIRKLLADPPKVLAYTEHDTHDDFEGFMARAVVQCWAAAPENPEWREVVGRFVTAYRYRTVRHLFDEAFRLRTDLRGGYGELEALAVSFAVARREATKLLFLRTRSELDLDAVQVWREQWLSRFAQGNGPEWVPDWSTIEKAEEFSPKTDTGYGAGINRYELRRRGYGLDMGVVLASFGNLPPLAEAASNAERGHWLAVCSEMLGAFRRTLPPSESEDEKWKYEPWSVDEGIFEVAARRLFECSREDRTALWQPILNLPPGAHHHITQFLNAVLLEALRTEPPQIAVLVPIWGEMTGHLLGSEKWTKKQTRETTEVWKSILLYGTPFTTIGDQIFTPLVDSLRHAFERHIKTLEGDAHEQSSLAGFLTTKAGERLLVDAFVWLRPGWEKASTYFWQTAVERGHFEQLLDHAWREHYDAVRSNPDAFKAFKALTMNLAARHVPTALQIQQQIGTGA